MPPVHDASTPPRLRTEIAAGISTYLALSYIFLLNPLLLARAGIDISAAFFGTVVTATLSTLIMGWWANLPFAVAPAPSITTFFVSFVCLRMGIPWESALTAVILSGLLSIAMTALTIKENLITTVSPSLQSGTVFAIAGFLVANGLVQAKLVSYPGGIIALTTNAPHLAVNATMLLVGLLVTLVFRLPALRFTGAPVLGILAATVVGAQYGITASTKAEFSSRMLLATFKVDPVPLLNAKFAIAILVFFIIDFFGGVGKYIALFKVMGVKPGKIDLDPRMGRALYVDGIGNIAGGLFGASSLAVFISSAVGVVSGGRTGRTALVVAILMALSLFLIPLVGAIPVEATAGVLVYVGVILLPYDELRAFGRLRALDVAVWLSAAALSFITYGIDKALCLVFVVYTLETVVKGPVRRNVVLIGVTVLLLVAVVMQSLM